MLKNNMSSIDNDYSEAIDKNQALIQENERLKNELLNFQEKLKIISNNAQKT